jgi:hypothetical protein
MDTMASAAYPGRPCFPKLSREVDFPACGNTPRRPKIVIPAAAASEVCTLEPIEASSIPAVAGRRAMSLRWPVDRWRRPQRRQRDIRPAMCRNFLHTVTVCLPARRIAGRAHAAGAGEPRQRIFARPRADRLRAPRTARGTFAGKPGAPSYGTPPTPGALPQW